MFECFLYFRKAETMFYKSQFYHNGKVLMKKAKKVKVIPYITLFVFKIKYQFISLWLKILHGREDESSSWRIGLVIHVLPVSYNTKPLQAPYCVLEQETVHLLLSTGWF